ncbi:MAG: hypothetical protein DCC65_15435 [Planctomycetota bacterium]|nr:MAG: hypothetical protein DCC65_15435 [Planctomycetota bacterium]
MGQKPAQFRSLKPRQTPAGPVLRFFKAAEVAEGPATEDSLVDGQKNVLYERRVHVGFRRAARD